MRHRVDGYYGGVCPWCSTQLKAALAEWFEAPVAAESKYDAPRPKQRPRARRVENVPMSVVHDVGALRLAGGDIRC